MGKENSISVSQKLKEGSEPVSRKQKDGSEPRSRRQKKDGTGAASEVEDLENGDFSIAVIERDDGDQYGCMGFFPPFLQCCRREPSAFLFVLCILATASIYIQNGAMPAAAVHLQRRFHLSAPDLAAIRTAFDFGSLIVLIPVLYYGEYGIHRPQWIGIGGLVVGAGAVLMTVPHFLTTDAYEPLVKNMHQICDVNKPDDCTVSLSWTKYIFIVGELLMGIGTMPYYTMGLTYLDENATHRQSTLYTAIFSTCRLIGPIIGNIMTGATLMIYGDVNKWPEKMPEYDKIDPDPNWYGAWWISILLGAMLSWLGSALMFPFPNQLSGATVAHIRDTRDAMLNASYTQYDDPMTGDTNVVKKLKDVLGNRVFLGAMIEMCARFFMVSGLFAFLPKYMVNIFEISAADASFYVGLVIIAAALFGLLYGTVLQYLFHLDVGGNLRLSMAAALGTVICASAFVVTCAPVNFAGANKPYNDSAGIKFEFKLDNRCNEGCNCSNQNYEPYCYKPDETSKSKWMTYYSMCHAGCQQYESVNKTATNCLCVADKDATLTKGRCGSCSYYVVWAFLIGISWLGVTLFMRYNAVQQILLRAVHFQLRSVSLAMSMGFMHLTAALPAPFVFASLLDFACVGRVTICKYEKCVWFKKETLSLTWFGMVFAMSLVSLIAVVFALSSHKPEGQILLVPPNAADNLKSDAKPPAKKGDKKSG